MSVSFELVKTPEPTEISEFLVRHAEFDYDPDLLSVFGREKGGQLVFVCQLYVDPDSVAIYSICTHKDHRYKGIMRAAIQWIAANYPSHILWVGIETRSPYSYLQMYGKVGFERPYRTKNCPYYGTINEHVIGMTRKPLVSG